MLRKRLRLPLYVLLACCFGIAAHSLSGSEDPALRNAESHSLGGEARAVYSSLTAHEWGTFTSIAGRDGGAVQWSPLTGSADLPGFVEHFRNAGFKLGLRATVRMAAKMTAGGKLLVENRSGEEIPNPILFERRGGKAGYRIGGAMRKDAVLDPPELTASIDDLGRDLEGMLVGQGLYQDEAHAMVETWRTSWFEEGSRLLYILPAAFVDGMLQLSTNHDPAQA